MTQAAAGVSSMTTIDGEKQMANSSLIKRLERLEQGDSPGETPDRINALVKTFGGRPEDYWADGHWMTLEELVSGSMEEDRRARPETAGGNTDDTPAGTDSGRGA